MADGDEEDPPPHPLRQMVVMKKRKNFDIERRINGFLSESIDRRYLASIDCDMLAVNPNSCRTCHKRNYSRDLGCGP